LRSYADCRGYSRYSIEKKMAKSQTRRDRRIEARMEDQPRKYREM
jgi:hypothetical protein